MLRLRLLEVVPDAGSTVNWITVSPMSMTGRLLNQRAGANESV